MATTGLAVDPKSFCSKLNDGNQIAFHCDFSHEVKHISAHLASLWICCLAVDLA